MDSQMWHDAPTVQPLIQMQHILGVKSLAADPKCHAVWLR
jgi:hypothetical protein